VRHGTLTTLLESDEYKSIKDTGVDVLAMLEKQIEAGYNHHHYDVESGAIFEGDPDYGFTEG